MALGLIGSITLSAQITSKEKKAAQAVIERNYPQLADHLDWISINKVDDHDVFQQSIEDNRLKISASSAIAACRGVYDFIRQNEYGISSWTGNRLMLPQQLEGSEVRQIVSPFVHHYYLNVVTYGYSMPYWDWKRWEKEIDWMALHGIDMPLALVANEAISARVWKKLGLTDQEIAAYFVGPAHLPWMRMGNISGIDGPMPKEWHKEQIALQHKILKRMRSLGMHPICPGFAGFVPQAMKRLHPNIKITETSWGGAFHNWMLSPQENLFHTIGKLFIEEWEKEFGQNQYYLVDSFNEMDIPFPPKDDPSRYSLLASYGDKVYQSIKAGNPNATWVMQGWMFGYQRHIWDYNTLKALVSKVPDDKMLLLDLAVDYNRCFWHSEVNWDFYKGFYNKPWVYSVIPNMGGKSGMTGILDFYANGHLDALNSPNRGQLVAHGMAPEGIENNEVVYELIADAGWSNKHIDIKEWLKNYSLSRYGIYNEGLALFWHGMLQSVYGSFTDHPRYNWKLRPGLTRKGTINISSAFYQGIETLTKIAPSMAGNPLFEYDFREWAVAYAGGKAEQLTQQIEDAYQKENKDLAGELEQKFTEIMQQMDLVLSGHPTKDLQRWLDFARQHGKKNPQLADYYEKNARRIVTIWGPPVDDYSARIWAGLIRDYYLPRWQHYFEQKRTGTAFDFPKWERQWVEKQKGLSQPYKTTDAFTAAIQLVQMAADNMKSTISQDDLIGNWNIGNIAHEENSIEWSISPAFLKEMTGVRLQQMNKGAKVTVITISLIADGKNYTLSSPNQCLNESRTFTISLPKTFTANNECKLRISMRNEHPITAKGTCERVK